MQPKVYVTIYHSEGSAEDLTKQVEIRVASPAMTIDEAIAFLISKKPNPND